MYDVPGHQFDLRNLMLCLSRHPDTKIYNCLQRRLQSGEDRGTGCKDHAVCHGCDKVEGCNGGESKHLTDP